MKADVGVRIVQRVEQRSNGGRMMLLPERECRLDPQVHVSRLQQLGQRRGEIDVGHRQQLQRAAQDAKAPVLAAKRGQHRPQQLLIGAGRQPVDRRPAHAPVFAVE